MRDSASPGTHEAPVLITGATGFVGGRLIGQLLAAGRRVRVLVRDPRRLPDGSRRRVEIVEGDLRDPAAVDRAVEGARTVLHLAAVARAWAPDPAIYQEVNVAGVARLLEAAARHGVARLVHVSTILTLPPYLPAPVTGPARRPTPYERSKREGEELVERYAELDGNAVMVHPTRVYGPGPLTDANGVTVALRSYLRGRLRVRIADGGVLANYVHVADVAAGIRLAAERGRRGAHYVLGGRENVSFPGLLEETARLARVRRVVLPIPPEAALLAGRLGELWGVLTGSTSLTRRWVRVFLEDRRVDIGPASRELGYAPRRLADGLGETVRWLQRGAPPRVATGAPAAARREVRVS